MVKKFKSLQAKGNPFLDRVQANVSIFADSLINIPILDGTLIEDVTLSTSEVQIEHKLGREPKGWIIVKKNAAQDIYESSSTLPKQFLSLTAAGTVTASLWVF